MNDVDTVRSSLKCATKSQQAVFACACAERTANVFRRLAVPTSVAVYDDILNTAWDAVKTRKAFPAERRESLNSVPEAEIDDSHRRGYYATLALGILENALDLLDASDAGEAADLACCQTIDLYSCFDAIAIGSPSMIVDPAKSPPSGRLELAEIEAQLEAVRILTAGREVGTTVCEQLRERAKTVSRILDSAITELITSRN